MIHPDVQLMLAHDIQRDRMEAAARHRLARAARGDRERRRWHRTWTARRPSVGTRAVQLETC